MAAKLNARLRTEHGKGAARVMRRDGYVPAVIYGHGDDTRSLTIQTLELEKLVSTISVENTIIDLAVDGAKPTQALIREIQYHPARRQILHLDLYQIHAGEKIHLEIPIHLQGAPIGVREEGGVLQEVLRDLEVECLPRDIPESFDIDISQLGIGDSVHVRDLSLPNVKILNDPELVICAVAAPTIAELPESAESEDGVDGDVEPELIRDRDDDATDTPAEQGQG
jgi:large subunit ribosomal protein L25